MANAVKGSRATGRGSRARQTRRRIVAAAAELFIADGYTGTTLEQIAERAGVAVQTVYFHFGNKRTVLRAVVDVAAVGDDQPIDLLDRPLYRQLAHERDPRRYISLWTGGHREILTRMAPILRLLRDAAGTDPDVAAQWQANEQYRVAGYRDGIVQHLADLDALKPGLTTQDTLDILLALTTIDVYLTLTERGWSPDKWQTWMTDTITTALLPAPTHR
jgi:AcrR family transcriptional regulator